MNEQRGGMSTGKIALIAVIAIVLLVVFGAFGTYNSLVIKKRLTVSGQILKHNCKEGATLFQTWLTLLKAMQLMKLK